MATAPDQSILEALRGYVVESTKQPRTPTPRLVKIYISSTKQGKLENMMKRCESVSKLRCVKR